MDSNGAALETGDTITLIKDLNVKGANTNSNSNSNSNIFIIKQY